MCSRCLIGAAFPGLNRLVVNAGFVENCCVAVPGDMRMEVVDLQRLLDSLSMVFGGCESQLIDEGVFDIDLTIPVFDWNQSMLFYKRSKERESMKEGKKK